MVIEWLYVEMQYAIPCYEIPCATAGQSGRYASEQACRVPLRLPAQNGVKAVLEVIQNEALYITKISNAIAMKT